MKTKRELAEQQIALQNRVNAVASINIVTCGNCGSVLLHDRMDSEIECACCKSVMDLSDCPDLWYEGCQNNGEFEEEETYLGNIEGGLANLKVYATDYGYRIKFYFNDNEQGIADCLDSDHVWRELRARGYKKYFCKAVLSML
jgi:hypothetical protein